MSSSKLVSPDKVTNKEFAELLANYEPLIDSISASKGGTSALDRGLPRIHNSLSHGIPNCRI